MDQRIFLMRGLVIAAAALTLAVAFQVAGGTGIAEAAMPFSVLLALLLRIYQRGRT